MATLLDGASGLMAVFLPFFMAIFAWVITFAFLEKTQVLGDNKGRNSMIALVIGLTVLALPDITRLISVIVPWFFFVFLFFMLITIGFMFVGGNTEDMYKVLGKEGAVWFFIVIGAIIVALAAGNIYGDQLLAFTEGDSGNQTPGGPGDTATGSFRQNLGATLFHPSIIGMMALLIIATLAILFLSDSGPKT